jgi:hypothetical protein
VQVIRQLRRVDVGMAISLAMVALSIWLAAR